MGSSADFSRYGPALRRVRAGERAEPDGGKKVWHQASGEVELLSHVDAHGRVTRQECHLGGTVVIWRAGMPLSTGSSAPAVRTGPVSPSETIAADGQVSRGAVLQALSLLQAAPPGDRYIDHLRGELESALAGMDSEGEDTVTTMQRRDLLLPAEAPQAQRRTAWVAVGAGGAVLLLGLAAFWLLR